MSASKRMEINVQNPIRQKANAWRSLPFSLERNSHDKNTKKFAGQLRLSFVPKMNIKRSPNCDKHPIIKVGEH